MVVSSMQFCQVTPDTFFQLVDAGFALAIGEVLVTFVYRFELTTVDREEGFRNLIELPTMGSIIGAKRLSCALSWERSRFGKVFRRVAAGKWWRMMISLMHSELTIERAIRTWREVVQATGTHFEIK